jgi:hypothetical protein
LLNSALISAIRKPPSTSGFKLEGVVALPALMKEFKRLAPQLPASVAPPLLASPEGLTKAMGQDKDSENPSTNAPNEATKTESPAR